MNKKTAFSAADILLPDQQHMSGVWAVCACDQYTGEPAYWAETDRLVGEKPSALRLILPEAKLNSPDVDRHIADINAAMERYLKDGLFETLENLIKA